MLILIVLASLAGCTTLRQMTSSYKDGVERLAKERTVAGPSETDPAPARAARGEPGLPGDKANAKYVGAPVVPQ